jgi:hypothetical protein
MTCYLLLWTRQIMIICQFKPNLFIPSTKRVVKEYSHGALRTFQRTWTRMHSHTHLLLRLPWVFIYSVFRPTVPIYRCHCIFQIFLPLPQTGVLINKCVTHIVRFGGTSYRKVLCHSCNRVPLFDRCTSGMGSAPYARSWCAKWRAVLMPWVINKAQLLFGRSQ